MKIAQIEVAKKDLGNAKPYTIAFKTVDEVFNIIVRITLENGVTGMGSGNPSEYVVGESIDDAHRVLAEENIQFLIGRDIREFYGLLGEVQEKLPNNPGARAALDIALHDAFTKNSGIPLGLFLGQKIRSLPTSVTIGIMDVEKTLREAKQYFDLGFRVLKVKTGKEVEEDVERIAKLREKYGDQITIRVDANQGYDKADLLRFCDKTERMNIELIEQPLSANQVDEMKGLPKEIKRKIAVDESLISPESAFLLASPPNAGDIFNIKLMKSGGIYPAQQIATIAANAHIDLMWGCNDESIISISAALHTALSFANTKYLDLDGSLDLLHDVVQGGFNIKDGGMSITSKPGLGVSEV